MKKLLFALSVCIFLTFLPAEVFADDWHWQKTNAAYLGPTEDEATAGAVTVKANHGQNDRDMVYNFDVTGRLNASNNPFHSCKGESSWFNVNYYRGIGDSFKPARPAR